MGDVEITPSRSIVDALDVTVLTSTLRAYSPFKSVLAVGDVEITPSWSIVDALDVIVLDSALCAYSPFKSVLAVGDVEITPSWSIVDALDVIVSACALLDVPFLGRRSFSGLSRSAEVAVPTYVRDVMGQVSVTFSSYSWMWLPLSPDVLGLRQRSTVSAIFLIILLSYSFVCVRSYNQ